MLRIFFDFFKRNSTLDVGSWMSDAYSAPKADSTFRPWQAGINPISAKLFFVQIEAEKMNIEH